MSKAISALERDAESEAATETFQELLESGYMCNINLLQQEKQNLEQRLSIINKALQETQIQKDNSSIEQADDQR